MRFSRDKTESEGEITRQLSLPDSATVGNQVASTSFSLLKASRLLFLSMNNSHYLDASYKYQLSLTRPLTFYLHV